jgi:Matrixin
MSSRIPALFTTVLLAIATMFSNASQAYTTNGAKWNRASVTYIVNPTNMDQTVGAATTALQAGATVWAQQSSAAIALQYGGQTSQTTLTNDGLNVVLFRNDSSGSAIATTYTWSSNGTLVDADIVFWDAAFQFFAGTAGCSNGFYVEDIAAHEFGHALGLGHSSSADATMYPSVSYCNTSNRTLAADDLAGILALYGPRDPAPAAPKGLRFVGIG